MSSHAVFGTHKSCPEENAIVRLNRCILLRQDLRLRVESKFVGGIVESDDV